MDALHAWYESYIADHLPGCDIYHDCTACYYTSVQVINTRAHHLIIKVSIRPRTWDKANRGYLETS